MPTLEISISDLHKAFSGHQVLKGIDLDIHRGNLLAIVGGSGSGKTVLLNHVLGQLRPDRGRILVANHHEPGSPLVDLAEAGEFTREDIHKHWGVVFQRNALFSGTVLDNIALWLREVKRLEEAHIAPIARRALDAVGLPTDDRFLELPQEQLSGGMSKRLAVARALAMDPVVVFYDEPTTGLDPVSAAQIHELIAETHRMREGRTTVIITHDKDLLSRLRPRTVMLYQGKVFFDGPFEEFEASDSSIIRPYFDMMPVLQQRAPADTTAAPAEHGRRVLA